MEEISANSEYFRIRLGSEEGGVAELMPLRWDRFADALRPQDRVVQIILHGSHDVMEWALASILRGESIALVAATKKLLLDLTILNTYQIRSPLYYPVLHFDPLDVLSSPEKIYTDTGALVMLTPEERARWFLLPSKVAALEYLRSLAASQVAQNSEKSEDAEFPVAVCEGESTLGGPLTATDSSDGAFDTSESDQ